MTAAETQEIAAVALAMPARKRAALAHSLLASLPPPPCRHHDDWDAVLARRAEEVASGSAMTVPSGAAMREIRSRLRRP
jgi:hypothetical protein